LRFEFRHLIGWALVLAGCAFLAINSLILYRGAYKFGHDEVEKVALGIAASIVPWIIAALPLVITETWKPLFGRFRRPSLSTGFVAFVWVVFVFYNLAGGAGVIATSRLETVADRDKVTENTIAIRQERDNKANQLAGIPKHRPAAAVERLVAAEKQNRRWDGSGQCKDATAKASREFCDQVQRLEGELENARAADRYTAEIAALNARLAIAAPTIASSDPQAEIIHDVTGFSKAKIQVWLPAMTPIVLEIGAALTWHFGFLVLGIGLRKAPPRAAEPPPEPAPVIRARLMSPERAKAASASIGALTHQRKLCEWFWSNCSRPVASGALPEDDWYRHYVAICERSSDAPLLLESFRRIAARYVSQIQNLEGIVYYHGLLPLVPEDAV